ERDGLDRVADLAMSGKRHDFAQVGVAAPERAVESLFARNAWEQRNIDAIADQSHIDIVTADRQEVKRQLQNPWSPCAIHDRFEGLLSRASIEFLAGVGR